MKTKQRHRKGGRPDKKILAEIVERVVEAAQPDKIILFGSAARGELGPKSDIDLMVELDPASKVSLWDYPAMQDDFSALFGHRKVDIASPEILENPYRRKSILPDLKTLYEARH